ncbi:hypothetical protein DLJ53_27555 [Acuticoccus sediminis]|uniref:Uncharacterized protein n=2 Tax=Acuticoccus sediminis TaxID=2184697 RepID=A0A8B2NHT4_9HYPH|nr:hypothetical protein DLJ53_27555 [Acuticoccus sediminis]
MIPNDREYLLKFVRVFDAKHSAWSEALLKLIQRFPELYFLNGVGWPQLLERFRNFAQIFPLPIGSKLGNQSKHCRTSTTHNDDFRNIL